MNDRENSNLVEAVPAKTLERYVAEIDMFDRAILEAQATASLEAEALAHQLAAEFYLEWGKEKIAAVYMQDAYNCYDRSGAKTKTEQLEQAYPQLLKSILPQRQQFGGTNYFTDEFVATIGYEFRNPLNGILGMSEALLEEVFGTMNERQLNAVSTIDRSGGYLLALINNMTDLSQLQVGKLELEMSQVNVLELCQFSCTFVKHHAIQKQIQLDLDVCANAGTILVDLQRMRQVLINLLDRAIDATPVGGRVKLIVTRDREGSTFDPNSSIQFSTIDTSKEIPITSDGKLSQSLLPVESKHIGLGLMLVNPIVELHGGTLTCQSIIGQGSYVKVSLPDTCPIVDAEIDPDNSADYLGADADTIADENPESPLILIVEDNELNINTISSYLTAKGYRPIVAQDGASAIELTQKYHPNLILMDVQMPGMDGIEAISRIRENPQLAAIPIVALTALAMEGDRDKCLNAGANDYLTKPVKLKQLDLTIQQWLH
jgi:signal transduction histidine kinase/CheY-like chemotaxis protein